LLSTEPAVVEAVRVTGPVITGAGVIMALAFLGMLFNTNKFLNEFGFVMITGVLVDTFVVRTVLVPSVLSTGGRLNWWPVRMPGRGD
jgi:RND superfamily putative drug exporter